MNVEVVEGRWPLSWTTLVWPVNLHLGFALLGQPRQISFQPVSFYVVLPRYYM